MAWKLVHCIANQLNGFYMIHVFTERSFQSDCNLHKKQWLFLLNEATEKK